MAVKVKIATPKKKGIRARLGSPIVRGAVAAFIILCVIAFSIFAFYYVRYQKIVDERIRRPIFNNAAKIYAAPEVVETGETWPVREIANELRKAGYTEAGEQGQSKLGTYAVHGESIDVRPGAESYHSAEGATIFDDDKGKVSKITSDKNGGALDAFELEPILVTGLFDSKDRSKQRLITYDDVPKMQIDAILSIEDKRFFEHGGINYFRLAEAAIADIERGKVRQGGSTLTMQVARGFFLNNRRNFRRKVAEMMIAMELEQRFSKKQILELYMNHVDMGQRGSFNIRGFGEAAQAYFNKDIKSLSLPEMALLAGLVNGPTYYSPYRHPDRALERRNLVLQAMFENHAITQQQEEQAKAAPLGLAPPNVDASEAPYFVDLVRDSLLARYKDSDLTDGGLRIYTTLDPALQKVASQAIDIGMKQVDEIVLRHRTHKVKIGKGKNAKTETKVTNGPMPQVALIALDPHTGNVLALSGGRNYAFSQLDHAVAKRPTGSIFKPFVYATAINTALTGDPSQAFTQTTMIDATQQTWQNDDQTYTPRNFEGETFTGDVTARFALQQSINTAAIKMAEMVGFDKVAQLARTAGISSVKATPAMAIGAYDASPLEMAGAYTVFANSGTRVSPTFISSVRTSTGEPVEDFSPEKTSILDPRVVYVVTDMLENVINHGTAAGVRGRGFYSPAAGKTGTSHDAWFAGYTSNLLCIVWVGNDDYSDIKIEGAKAAAPIWAEFMKRAVALQEYKDVKPFTAPSGVTTVTLDKTTNLLATAACPDDYQAAFIDGTAPTATCDHPNGDTRNLLEKIFGLGSKPNSPAAVSNTPQQHVPAPGQPGVQPGQTSPGQPPAEEPKKKKGFWHRLFGGDKQDQGPTTAPNPR